MSALAEVVDVLRCPVCTAPLVLQVPEVPEVPEARAPAAGPRVLACGAGHRFDVARQGHVVLVPGGSRLRADTADMVAARRRVMASGAFDPVRSALGDACSTGPLHRGPARGLVVDLGAGPGTYTAAVLDRLPSHRGLALELSVPALRAAARAHDRLAAVGVDLTRPLPLLDGAVGPEGVLMAVFAPLPGDEELRRVTSPGTRLVVLTPTPDHLAALRGRLALLDVPAGKPDRLDERLAGAWEPTARAEVSAQVRLPRPLAADTVAMGPNAWHTDARLRDALADLPDHLDDTLAVTVSTYHRRAVP